MLENQNRVFRCSKSTKTVQQTYVYYRMEGQDFKHIKQNFLEMFDDPFNEYYIDYTIKYLIADHVPKLSRNITHWQIFQTFVARLTEASRNNVGSKKSERTEHYTYSLHVVSHFQFYLCHSYLAAVKW